MLVEATTLQHSQTSSYRYIKTITGIFFCVNDYLNNILQLGHA